MDDPKCIFAVSRKHTSYSSSSVSSQKNELIFYQAGYGAQQHKTLLKLNDNKKLLKLINNNILS